MFVCDLSVVADLSKASLSICFSRETKRFLFFFNTHTNTHTHTHTHTRTHTHTHTHAHTVFNVMISSNF